MSSVRKTDAQISAELRSCIQDARDRMKMGVQPSPLPQTKAKTNEKKPSPPSQTQTGGSLIQSRCNNLGTLNSVYGSMYQEFRKTNGSKNMVDIVSQLASDFINEMKKGIVQKIISQDKIIEHAKAEIEKSESESKLPEHVKNMLILARTLIKYSSNYQKDPENEGTTHDSERIEVAKTINELSEILESYLIPIYKEGMANQFIEHLTDIISKAITTYGKEKDSEVIKKAHAIYTSKNIKHVPDSDRLKYLEMLVIGQYKIETTIEANMQLKNNGASVARTSATWSPAAAMKPR